MTTSNGSSSRPELIDGTLTYEQSLRDYFRDLVAAHGEDASAIWSIDGVHLEYLPRTWGER